MQAWEKHCCFIVKKGNDYLMEVCPKCFCKAQMGKKGVGGFHGPLNQPVQEINHLHYTL